MTDALHAAESGSAALHIAALAFPSHQGTQAAIRFMLDALVEGGGAPELLTYASGSSEPLGFPHHRARALVRDRSLRSGPSAAKVVNDVALAAAAAWHARRFPLVVAHHVEAAAAARFTRRPVLFVAHTSLGPELPTYFDPRWSGPATRIGRSIDRRSMRGASAVAAVSPLLADDLSALTPQPIHVLPLPWPVPTPTTAEERHRARDSLGLAPEEPVVLYAGNLDGYQGLELLLEAMDATPATLLLATEDAPSRLPGLTGRVARGRVRLTGLSGEAARRLAHAAADVVALPRRAPGGLPVKLLDALARGVPVAAMPRALAGHGGVPAVTGAANDAPSLAEALQKVLQKSASEREALGNQGRAYVASAHSAAAFRAAFAGAVEGALTARR